MCKNEVETLCQTVNMGRFTVFVHNVLIRVDLVTLCRVVSLSRELRGELNELFWKQHCHLRINPRHTDEVIESMTTQSPWRDYALMFSPRIGRRLMKYQRSTDGPPSMTVTMLPARIQDVILTHRHGDHQLTEEGELKFLDNRLVATGIGRVITDYGVYTRKRFVMIKGDGTPLLPTTYSAPIVTVSYYSIPENNSTSMILVTHEGRLILTRDVQRFSVEIPTPIAMLKVSIRYLSENYMNVYALGIDGNIYRLRIDFTNPKGLSYSVKALPKCGRFIDISTHCALTNIGDVYIYDDYELTKLKNLSNIVRITSECLINNNDECFIHTDEIGIFEKLAFQCPVLGVYKINPRRYICDCIISHETIYVISR